MYCSAPAAPACLACKPTLQPLLAVKSRRSPQPSPWRSCKECGPTDLLASGPGLTNLSGGVSVDLTPKFQAGLGGAAGVWPTPLQAPARESLSPRLPRPFLIQGPAVPSTQVFVPTQQVAWTFASCAPLITGGIKMWPSDRNKREYVGLQARLATKSQG